MNAARARRFRGLSLDLWYTVLVDAPDLHPAVEADRSDLLARVLFGAGAGATERERVVRALAEVREDERRAARPPDLVGPRSLVEAVAVRLGRSVQGRADEVAREFSNAGVGRYRNNLNGEARVLLERLRRREVPVVLTTNSGRLGDTWAKFLTRELGLPLFRVVSSCEVGARKPDPEIFRQSAAVLGFRPEEILHVGDRWDLDVLGARAAGMAPGLYRGLWHRYWDPEEPEAATLARLDDGGDDVLRLDDLRVLDDERLWAPP